MRTVTPRVSVLGVGNLLLRDEGVGVRCVQEVERMRILPSHVVLVDGGTSTHELLADLEDLDLLVIVDAILSRGAPGTLIVLDGADVPSAFSNTFSPHQHGIHDLLATLSLLGRGPKRLVFLGVIPSKIDLGMDLSPEVAAAMPSLIRAVAAAVAGVGPS